MACATVRATRTRRQGDERLSMAAGSLVRFAAFSRTDASTLSCDVPTTSVRSWARGGWKGTAPGSLFVTGAVERAAALLWFRLGNRHCKFVLRRHLFKNQVHTPS
jgi:hypothetical protein